MKTRAALVLMAVGGVASAAHGQAQVFVAGLPVSMTYSMTFAEYNTATQLPVAVSNGVIDPGESAFIRLTIGLTPPPAFGAGATDPLTVATWNPAVVGGHGSGWLYAIGGAFIDILGNGGGSNAQGTWSTSGGTGANARGTLAAWAVGDSTTFGTPAQGGARLANIQMGQLAGNLLSLNRSSPVTNIWRGLWTPAVYGGQIATFVPGANSAGVNTSSALLADSTFPQGNTIPLGAQTNNTFGIGVSIPVANVPGPSSLALLGLGGLIAGRRRR